MAQFEMSVLLQRKTQQSLKICNKITLGLFRNKEFNGFKMSNQHYDNNANNNLVATWRKLSSSKFQSNRIQSSEICKYSAIGFLLPDLKRRGCKV